MTIIAAITAMTSALSACSSEGQEREYTVPSSLCGTAIEATDLAPFLPAGHKITVRDKPYSGTKRCEVVVDNTLIVTTTQMWLKEGDTTAIFAYGQTLDTPKNSAEGGRFQYSGYEAFGKTHDCVDTKAKQALYTAIQAQGSKHRDADAMKRLILSYTKEVESSTECGEGAS
ncbi:MULTISPECIES: hypothetical protein [Streptomyces]|uniref:hypothetical protein n=1 Tax=Streptomyces TaxID=1883 RepID=UPI0022506205|nr:hypothetical protein [Streptomyces sp. NBC_01373]MCX4697515.1 hypothetical protein [Streptomyces sp. NBC_01373]